MVTNMNIPMHEWEGLTKLQPVLQTGINWNKSDVSKRIAAHTLIPVTVVAAAAIDAVVHAVAAIAKLTELVFDTTLYVFGWNPVGSRLSLKPGQVFSHTFRTAMAIAFGPVGSLISIFSADSALRVAQAVTLAPSEPPQLGWWLRFYEGIPPGVVAKTEYVAWEALKGAAECGRSVGRNVKYYTWTLAKDHPKKAAGVVAALALVYVGGVLSTESDWLKPFTWAAEVGQAGLADVSAAVSTATSHVIAPITFSADWLNERVWGSPTLGAREEAVNAIKADQASVRAAAQSALDKVTLQGENVDQAARKTVDEMGDLINLLVNSTEEVEKLADTAKDAINTYKEKAYKEITRTLTKFANEKIDKEIDGVLEAAQAAKDQFQKSETDLNFVADGVVQAGKAAIKEIDTNSQLYNQKIDEQIKKKAEEFKASANRQLDRFIEDVQGEAKRIKDELQTIKDGVFRTAQEVNQAGDHAKEQIGKALEKKLQELAVLADEKFDALIKQIQAKAEHVKEQLSKSQEEVGKDAHRITQAIKESENRVIVTAEDAIKQIKDLVTNMIKVAPAYAKELLLGEKLEEPMAVGHRRETGTF